VLVDEVDALDHGAVGAREDAEHAAALAGVGAGSHEDLVTLADARHQTTSGASETIFM
jgi:hypothetical protein